MADSSAERPGKAKHRTTGDAEDTENTRAYDIWPQTNASAATRALQELPERKWIGSGDNYREETQFIKGD